MNELQIRKYKIDQGRLIRGSKQSMYVIEVIVFPIKMQTRLSNPRAIKFRSDLGFNQINLILKRTVSSNTRIKNIFCRKNKTTAQNLRK